MKYLRHIGIAMIICAVTSCIKWSGVNLLGTHTDPDKFECKVNGAEYLPYDGKIYIVSPLIARVLSLPNRHQLTIKATAYVDNNPPRVINLSIPNVTGAGIYEFNIPGQYASYDYKTYYITAQPGYGNITLTTFDTVSNVVAGTFSFNAIGPSDSVKVTGGHFNVNYATK